MYTPIISPCGNILYEAWLHPPWLQAAHGPPSVAAELAGAGFWRPTGAPPCGPVARAAAAGCGVGSGCNVVPS